MASFKAILVLKGVSGNLSFSVLYEAAWNLTEQLRPRTEPADPALVEALEKEYRRTLDLIGKLFS